MRDTQCERIRNYIRANGSITPMAAFTDLGITKLATRVSEMIRDGEKIVKTPVCKKRADGSIVRYMEYRYE